MRIYCYLVALSMACSSATVEPQGPGDADGSPVTSAGGLIEAPSVTTGEGGSLDEQQNNGGAVSTIPESQETVDWSGVKPSITWSFTTTKNKLEGDVYFDHRVTFYCGCNYSESKDVDATACGYVPPGTTSRDLSVEWEHVVPAAVFGRGRECWEVGDANCTTKGRACCSKVDPVFKAMEADMMNLVPAIGRLNLLRSDKPYGVIAGEVRAFGACDFEVTADTAEPMNSILGDIARTTLYMSNVYKSDFPALSKEEVDALWKQHLADPPDAWEKLRNERIAALQGAGNPLVE